MIGKGKNLFGYLAINRKTREDNLEKEKNLN